MVSTASPKPAAATRPLLSPSIDKDRLPFAGTAILAEAHCDAKWKPFKTLERASVIHFPNNPARMRRTRRGFTVHAVGSNKYTLQPISPALQLCLKSNY